MLFSLLLAIPVLCFSNYSQAKDDCGLLNFFTQLSDRVYCDAESGGNRVDEILKDGEVEFEEILSNCTPSQDKAEELLHYVASTGTPTMLNRWAKTPHFNGYDNQINESGGIPIMTAAFYGNIYMVEALLKVSAVRDVVITTKDGAEKTVTPESMALKVPEVYMADSFAAIGVLPTILSSAARNKNYPFPQDFLEQVNKIGWAEMAPFYWCERLLKAARKATRK